MVAHFWASEVSLNEAYALILTAGRSSIHIIDGDKTAYRSVRCVKDSIENGTSIDLNDRSVTNHFALLPNNPNPFNSSTTIQYVLSEPSHARLVIYDLLGQEIQILQNGVQNAGDYSLTWDVTNNKNIPKETGIYFYSLQTNNRTLKKKMILIQ
jgi:hypothetical protein